MLLGIDRLLLDTEQVADEDRQGAVGDQTGCCWG